MSTSGIVSSPVKAALIFVGLGMGVLDVKEKFDELGKAMASRTPRAIGQTMFIRDPYFVVKTWGGHAGTCGKQTWCYLAPPGEPRTDTSAISPWAKVGPVYAARLAVFPIVQTGRSLFRQGWTSRAIFLFSCVVAFLLLRALTKEQDSLPGGVLLSVLGFLAVSVVLSFSLNLFLRLGNAVAGYWGVLVALVAGMYFLLELAGKVRELIELMRGGRAAN